MIQQSVECKRIGNEYVDLFRKLLQYIHYTNFSKDFITDDDLKMLSELEFYISSGKYEIIEFGIRKSPFDVREKLEELEEENEKLKDELEKRKRINGEIPKVIDDAGLDYYNEKLKERIIKLEDKLKELEEENKKLKFAMQDTYDSANDICSELQQRIDKAIKLLEEDYFEDGSGNNVEEVIKILKGEE